MNVTQSIVREIAKLEGVAPGELPPLYETIDTEALDRTLTSLTDAEGSFEFTYADYEVRVDSNGDVRVEPRNVVS